MTSHYYYYYLFLKTHFLLFHVVPHRWGSAAIFSTSSQIGAAFPAALCGSRPPRSMTAAWKPRSSESLLSEGCRGGRERVHVWPRNHWMTHHLHLIRRTHCLKDFFIKCIKIDLRIYTYKWQKDTRCFHQQLVEAKNRAKRNFRDYSWI